MDLRESGFVNIVNEVFVFVSVSYIHLAVIGCDIYDIDIRYFVRVDKIVIRLNLQFDALL